MSAWPQGSRCALSSVPVPRSSSHVMCSMHGRSSLKKGRIKGHLSVAFVPFPFSLVYQKAAEPSSIEDEQHGSPFLICFYRLGFEGGGNSYVNTKSIPA